MLTCNLQIYISQNINLHKLFKLIDYMRCMDFSDLLIMSLKCYFFLAYTFTFIIIKKKNLFKHFLYYYYSFKFLYVIVFLLL